MIKVGEWVLTFAGKIVYNKEGSYSFKNKKDAIDAICCDGNKTVSHKMPSGQYSIDVKTILTGELVGRYTLTKVTESNMNRVMSML